MGGTSHTDWQGKESKETQLPLRGPALAARHRLEELRVRILRTRHWKRVQDYRGRQIVRAI